MQISQHKDTVTLEAENKLDIFNLGAIFRKVGKGSIINMVGEGKEVPGITVNIKDIVKLLID